MAQQIKSIASSSLTLYLLRNIVKHELYYTKQSEQDGQGRQTLHSSQPSIQTWNLEHPWEVTEVGMGDSLFKKARELNCTVDGKEFNSKHWQLSRRKKISTSSTNNWNRLACMHDHAFEVMSWNWKKIIKFKTFKTKKRFYSKLSSQYATWIKSLLFPSQFLLIQ